MGLRVLRVIEYNFADQKTYEWHVNRMRDKLVLPTMTMRSIVFGPELMEVEPGIFREEKSDRRRE